MYCQSLINSPANNFFLIGRSQSQTHATLVSGINDIDCTPSLAALHCQKTTTLFILWDFPLLLPACLSRQCMSELRVGGGFAFKKVLTSTISEYSQQASMYLWDWLEWGSDTAKYQVIYSNYTDKPNGKKENNQVSCVILEEIQYYLDIHAGWYFTELIR